MLEQGGRPVALVTGAAGGIAMAACASLARDHDLVMVDLGCDLEGRGRDPSVVEEAAERIRFESDARVLALCEDVALGPAADEVVAQAEARFGRVDAAVLCAGVSFAYPFMHSTAAMLDRALGVHVLGSFGLGRACARSMIDGGRPGSLVFLTAPASFFGARGATVDGASSAAPLAMMRSAALELRKHRIRANSVLPLADTRMTKDSPLFQRVGADQLSARPVGEVIRFLSVPSLSGELSGEILGVAGGRIYSVKVEETPGRFEDPATFTAEDLKDSWSGLF